MRTASVGSMIAAGRGVSSARLDAELHELLHALLPRVHQGQVSSLAVCSAEAGEGRTHLALYVAEAMADHLHDNVLLVDADTVRPRIHRELKLDNQVGLAQVLRGQVPLADAVKTSASEHVHVLCAAAEDPVGPADITRESIERLLAATKQAYRVTILDTAPLLASSDSSSSVICSLTSGVLMVVLAGVTQGDFVARAHRVLLRAHAALVGVVVNDPRDEFQRDES